MTLAWLDPDGRKLLVTRLLRTFGYGYLAVVLAIYLQKVGLGASAVGGLLTAAVAGSTPIATGGAEPSRRCPR